MKVLSSLFDKYKDFYAMIIQISNRSNWQRAGAGFCDMHKKDKSDAGIHRVGMTGKYENGQRNAGAEGIGSLLSAIWRWCFDVPREC